MTKINEIENDPRYVKILDVGFCGIIDTMPHATVEKPGDWAIAQAARVSYGAGTKQINTDRGLIRYLMKHRHTSPIEMIEVKFHLRIPIFVMRQLVRHRTANLNEYSGRYSEMTDDFYIPHDSSIKPQSTTNKQGRGGEMGEIERQRAKNIISRISKESYRDYQILLGNDDGGYGIENPAGVSREVARIVLPLNSMTELYWKQDLHNLFHLLKLRTDPHAQEEIQILANAMFECIKPLFPIATEAWLDYSKEAVTISRMEKRLIETMLISGKGLQDILAQYDTPEKFLAEYGLTKREFLEFEQTWGFKN